MRGVAFGTCPEIARLCRTGRSMTRVTSPTRRCCADIKLIIDKHFSTAFSGLELMNINFQEITLHFWGAILKLFLFVQQQFKLFTFLWVDSCVLCKDQSLASTKALSMALNKAQWRLSNWRDIQRSAIWAASTLEFGTLARKTRARNTIARKVN